MDTVIKERINLYLCEYGCHNITVDVDEGVTPFMIGCEFRGREDRHLNPLKSKNGKCIGLAKSSFYPKVLPSGVPYPIPEYEWYKPKKLHGDVFFSGDDVLKLDSLELDHVKQGGLLMRKRTNSLPILHEINVEIEK